MHTSHVTTRQAPPAPAPTTTGQATTAAHRAMLGAKQAAHQAELALTQVQDWCDIACDPRETPGVKATAAAHVRATIVRADEAAALAVRFDVLAARMAAMASTFARQSAGTLAHTRSAHGQAQTAVGHAESARVAAGMACRSARMAAAHQAIGAAD